MEPKPEYKLVDMELPYNPLEIKSRSIGGIIVTWLVSFILGLMTIGIIPFATSAFILQPQEEAVILFWGKLAKVYKTPGIHWYNSIGRTIFKISTRIQTLDIKKTTVVDVNGNPIIVSAILTFRVENSLKASFGTNGVVEFMNRRSLATLKKVCSKYAYESKDGISLQTEADQVSREMVLSLQSRAKDCGVRVISFELADLQYAPEIAQGMLVRQQAQALLDARKVIVDGAVLIVQDALEKLSISGIPMDDREKVRLVSNLLAVICSDTKSHNTFNLTENVGKSRAEEVIQALQNNNPMLQNMNDLIQNYQNTKMQNYRL